MKNLNKKSKIIILAITLLLVCVILAICIFFVFNNNTVDDNINFNVVEEDNEENNEENKESVKEGKVDIIDLESNSRPYMLVVNNTDVAVKVQEGLNKAYLVYEIPTEGNTSRLLALYKDIEEDLVIGTIRSARHNFIDFALESDAIFCCFGWSIYAQNEMKTGVIDYFQGLYGEPFYRDNKENLALEHTAYTSMQKLKDYAKATNTRTTSDNFVLLNYDVDDVDLSKSENAKVANTVIIPYGAAPQIASFKYDSDTKMYIRYENGIKCVDHNTKEYVSTKNIIAIKLDYEMCDNNYYWNLKTVGTGEGYYITNGHAVEITWTKDNRSAKTVYKYKEGTMLNGVDVGGKEISVSDGRTWIEVQTTRQNLTIE